MEILTLTSLREKIFKIFDKISETGEPVLVKRKGKLIKIELINQEKVTEKLFNQPLKKNAVNGNSDDLIDFKSWEWNEKV